MTTLFEAIEKGDLISLRKLMRTGVDLRQIDEDSGAAPLAVAAESGRHDIVRILLRAGADPDWGGVTAPLGTAALEGHLEVAAALIEASADVDRPAADGLTPLITAASTGNARMVRMLLDAGANPDVLDDGGESAKSHAERKGHQEIVDILARVSGNGNVNVRWPPESLSAAIEVRDVARLNEILQREESDRERLLARNDGSGLTPLARAAQSGHVPLVRALLDAGADVAVGGAKTPLYAAAEARHARVVEALLEAGADVNAASGDRARTPVMAAAAAGHPALARLLIERGADPKIVDSDGKDALWHAASAGQEQTFALLLPHIKVADRKPATVELAAYVEQRRKMATSAARLIDYIHAGELDEAKRFLADGLTDPDGFDEEGRTAMMLAARLGRRDVLRLLIASGASFELTDDVDGYTALIHAVYSTAKNRRLTISLLAAAGADLDRPSADGRTPLMHAIDLYLDSETEDESELHDRAEPLIHTGADLEAPDADGLTAWMRVRERALAESVDPVDRRKLARVARLLERNGARMSEAWSIDLIAAAADGELGRVRDLVSNLSLPEDIDGLPLLSVAAAKANWDVVSFLLSAGIDINTANREGETILMQAARTGTLPIVEQLVQAGADAAARNAAGETAADIAAAAGHPEVAGLLRK